MREANLEEFPIKFSNLLTKYEYIIYQTPSKFKRSKEREIEK